MMDSTRAKDEPEKRKTDVLSRLINTLDLKEDAQTILKIWKAEEGSEGYPAERVLQSIQNSMPRLYDQDNGILYRSIEEMKKIYEKSILSGSPLHCKGFKESFALLRVHHHLLDSVRESSFVARAIKDLETFAKKTLPLGNDDVARLQGIYRASLSLYPLRGYPYRPLDVEMEEIRLLVILPNSNINSAIRCELITRNKNFMQAYTALSYCWGKSHPAKPSKIILEGRSFEVTPNLHAALRKLRDSTCRTCIWVDAVCINQADIEERNSQVSRMTAIYADALFVTCFLGDTENDSDLIMSWLLALHLAVDSKDRTTERTKGMTQPSVAQMKATMHLVSREYWSRVWIMQEVVLARGAYLCCGDYVISWETLTIFLLCISDTTEPPAHLPFYHETMSLASQWIIPLASLWNRKINSLPLSPLLCLTMSRQRYATVASDYIYGILGFAKSLPVPMDYRLGASSLYNILAVILVIMEDNLDWLTACKNFDPDFGFFTRQSSDTQAAFKQAMDSEKLSKKGARAALLSIATGGFEGTQSGIDEKTLELDSDEDPQEILREWEMLGLNCLPSWVPRWDQMILNHQYLVLNTKRNAKDQASADLSAEIVPLTEGTELQVTGLVLDKVAWLSAFKDEPKILGIRDIAEEAQIAESWLTSLAADWKLYDTNFTRKSRGPYGSVQSQKDAYISSIFMGASFKSDINEKLARENLASQIGWGSEKLANESPELARDTIPKTQTASSFRFFITEDGYMGRGPYQIKSGDLVCIFYGMKVPCILRPVRSNYYLLGECYIQGMMSGEAIKKRDAGLLQEQKFILI